MLRLAIPFMLMAGPAMAATGPFFSLRNTVFPPPVISVI